MLLYSPKGEAGTRTTPNPVADSPLSSDPPYVHPDNTFIQLPPTPAQTTSPIQPKSFMKECPIVPCCLCFRSSGANINTANITFTQALTRRPCRMRGGTP